MFTPTPFPRLPLPALIIAAAFLAGCDDEPTPSEEVVAPAFDERCRPEHAEFPPVDLPSGLDARQCLEDTSCRGIYVSAHRGNRKYGAPENSLQALRDAARDSVPFVEIDLRTTADGVVVNMHDESLLRTTGFDANVKDLTWEEIRALTLRSDDGNTHAVPTFNETLILAKELGVALYLDLKDIDDEVLVEHLQRHEALDIGLARVTSEARLVSLHTLEPSIWLMYNSEDISTLANARALVPKLQLIELGWFAPTTLVEAVRSAGFHIQQDVMATGDLAWLVKQSPATWFTSIEAGVQVPQSDHPSDLVSQLCNRLMQGD